MNYKYIYGVFVKDPFNEKNILVTGGAGFIGGHLVDKLLEFGSNVTVVDSMVTGQPKVVENHRQNKKYQFVKLDLLNLEKLKTVAKGKDFIFHIAANADIRGGVKNTKIDLEQNTIATYNVLEAMRINDIKKIVFTSSAAVYGETKAIPTPEDAPLVQNSLYGASKLAGESLIQAFSFYYGFNNFIYRFVSIIGERYPHGVVIDFFNKLKKDPHQLEILGNGKQKKSFLYINDCVNGVFTGVEKSKDQNNLFNLGNNYTIEVDKVADLVIEEMKLKSVKKFYTGGQVGWPGDQPIVLLSTDKIRSLGWLPTTSIENGIKKTAKYLLNIE